MYGVAFYFIATFVKFYSERFTSVRVITHFGNDTFIVLLPFFVVFFKQRIYSNDLPHDRKLKDPIQAAINELNELQSICVQRID